MNRMTEFMDGFLVCLFFCFFAALAVAIATGNIASNIVRTDAVEAGVAEYVVVSPSGDVEFRWKGQKAEKVVEAKP